MEYNHRAIEAKWKKNWDQQQTYKTLNDTAKPKYYVLDMFPYPSGSGLHVGHPLGYIASDIVARFKRQQGFNVLHPMGYDAFGLPAEQYAIQTGVHPAVSTEQNIQTYRAQLDNIGFSFDWSREVKTSDPSYYKWTQWIFLQLFEHYYDQTANKAKPISDLIQQFESWGSSGVNAFHSHDEHFSAEEWHAMSPYQKDQVLMNFRLAYRKTGYVNWCEALGTVLANDEVKDGVSERGGHPVERKAMMQWFLRITAYAHRLLDDMMGLDWPEALKTMQNNWIGRSEGAQLFFKIDGLDTELEIFTTRPDTIFGATFMVLAPEHELVGQLTTPEQKQAVDACIQYVKGRSERERMAEVKEMNGAFTGSYTIHPFNGEKVPIWIGDYVLKDYGTGAIMAVPSDDERDKTFAQKYNLPIVDVVDKTNYPGSTLHDKEGIIINSDFLNGMEVPDAIQLMFEKIEGMGIGKRRVNFKLRDANFSRQRYWGEPFPIVYDADGVAHALPESELPLSLPDLEDFKPTVDGQSPLAKATDWVKYGAFTRETDTMPGFAGSSWYFLRYMDATNESDFASPEALAYWQDVDFYIGGAEHAVGHLMYSRFWHKFLYDKGLVPGKEPFKKLVNQGMITGFGYYAENISFTTNITNSSIDVEINIQKIGNSLDLEINPSNINGIKFKEVTHPRRLPYIGGFLDSRNRIYKDKFIEYYKLFGDQFYLPENFDENYVWLKDIDTSSEFFTVNVIQEKMSKSKFNVVNPDDMVDKYGADCFRMYEMFLGPIEQSKPWDTKGIEGVSKFIKKLWQLMHKGEAFLVSDEKATKEELKVLHTAIKKVSGDIEILSLNTSVPAFMVCVNELKRLECNKREIMEGLVALIAPFAPFIAEELWSKLGKTTSVHHSAFPVCDESYLVEDNVVYPICINGKRKGELTFPNGADAATLEQMAMENDFVQKLLEGQAPKKVVVVPGRMINFVI